MQTNTQLPRKEAQQFLNSRRFSADLRQEGNGIGECYQYNKTPVRGYVYLDHYYLEERAGQYATVLAIDEVEGTLDEVENALLEYFLLNEGFTR